MFFNLTQLFCNLVVWVVNPPLIGSIFASYCKATGFFIFFCCGVQFTSGPLKEIQRIGDTQFKLLLFFAYPHFSCVDLYICWWLCKYISRVLNIFPTPLNVHLVYAELLRQEVVMPVSITLLPLYITLLLPSRMTNYLCLFVINTDLRIAIDIDSEYEGSNSTRKKRELDSEALFNY